MSITQILDKKTIYGWALVNNNPMIAQTADNGGRRSGLDLRQFSYTDHIPERRLGQDRRCGLDRRSSLERRSSDDRRRGSDIKEGQKAGAKIIELRSHKERRHGKDRRASDRPGGS